jgi:hypothetical protein
LLDREALGLTSKLVAQSLSKAAIVNVSESSYNDARQS